MVKSLRLRGIGRRKNRKKGRKESALTGYLSLAGGMGSGARCRAVVLKLVQVSESLEGCWNTDCWDLSKSFWFSRYGVEPENAYYQPLSKRCCCWFGDHPLRITGIGDIKNQNDSSLTSSRTIFDAQFKTWVMAKIQSWALVLACTSQEEQASRGGCLIVHGCFILAGALLKTRQTVLFRVLLCVGPC